MSTAQKRKAKPKAQRTAKAHSPRKRAVPTKKMIEKVAEAPPERKVVPPAKVFLIAVRLKGSFGSPVQIERTLASLRLNRKFNAILLENTASTVATLRKAKDFVTWGELKSAGIAALLRQRGELFGGLALTDRSVQEKFGEHSVDGLASALTQGRTTLSMLRQKGLRPVFRLRPPSGGFVRSTKRPFGSRGELGYRGPEISSLVSRMI
jgi:large subunit ribosomal protein L30